MPRKRTTDKSVCADSLNIGDEIFAPDGITRCRVRAAHWQRGNGTLFHLVYSPLTMRGHLTRTQWSVDLPGESLVYLAGQG